MATPREESILRKLREICLALPEATETLTWDHPNFRVAEKIFCIMGGEAGEPNITLKVGKPMLDVFLKDPRFYLAPYIGRNGWVSLKASTGRLNWTEIAALCRDSYRRVAPARLSKQIN
ncbi:MAG: MmcQ/YjbR family DNA-binding protein [Bryobacterales bacterium]|nr:MmcQ/YjbR family DNA-binding protein [Bryobacterales bacterium]